MSQQLTRSGAGRNRVRAILAMVGVVAVVVAAGLMRPGAARAAGSADLSVKQVFSGSSTSGNTIDTVTIHNYGPDPATNINVSKFLATTSGTFSVLSNKGVCERMPPPSTAWQLSDACQVGSLASGGSLVITVTWIGTAGVAFTSTVTVGSSEADAKPTNNISTASSWYGPRADLHLTQTASVGATSGKATVVHTVLNRGPNNASSLQLVVEVKATASVSFAFSSTTAGTACQTIPPASGFNFAYECNVSSLAANAKWVLNGTYTGTPSAAFSLKTTISAISPTDPVPADNTGTAAATFHS